MYECQEWFINLIRELFITLNFKSPQQENAAGGEKHSKAKIKKIRKVRLYDPDRDGEFDIDKIEPVEDEESVTKEDAVAVETKAQEECLYELAAIFT